MMKIQHLLKVIENSIQTAIRIVAIYFDISIGIISYHGRVTGEKKAC